MLSPSEGPRWNMLSSKPREGRCPRRCSGRLPRLKLPGGASSSCPAQAGKETVQSSLCRNPVLWSWSTIRIRGQSILCRRLGNGKHGWRRYISTCSGLGAYVVIIMSLLESPDLQEIYAYLLPGQRLEQRAWRSFCAGPPQPGGSAPLPPERLSGGYRWNREAECWQC